MAMSLRVRIRFLGVVAASAVAAGVLPSMANAEPGPSIASVAAQVESLQTRAAASAEAYNGAKLALASLEVTLGKAQDKLGAQQRTVDSATSTMGALAAAQYRSGGVDANLELLFSDDPAAFLQQVASLDQIADRQTELVRKVSVGRAQMAQTKLLVAQQTAAAQLSRNQLALTKQKIESDLAEAQRLLRTLKAEERARLEAARKLAAEREAAAARAARSAARAALQQSQSEPASVRSSAASGVSRAAGSGAAATAVSYAYSKLGSPYVWGAAGPDVFDCSGLTMSAWAAAGVSIPHFSGAQYGAGRQVPRSELAPGDLVFFYSPSEHVGIYVGGGQVIHAPRPGTSVRLTSISSMPYAGAVRP